MPLRIGVGRRSVQSGELPTAHERRPSPLGPFAHRKPNVSAHPPGSPTAQASRRSESLPDAIPASPRGILKGGVSRNIGHSGTSQGPLSYSIAQRSASVPDAVPASPRGILKGGASRISSGSGGTSAASPKREVHAGARLLEDDPGSPGGSLKGASRTWDVSETPPGSPTQKHRPRSVTMSDDTPPSPTESAKWTPIKLGVYGTPPGSPPGEKSRRSASLSSELSPAPSQTSPDASGAQGVYGTPPATPTRRMSLRSSSLPNDHSCSAAEMQPEGTAPPRTAQGVDVPKGNRALNALLTTTRLRALSRRLSRYHDTFRVFKISTAARVDGFTCAVTMAWSGVWMVGKTCQALRWRGLRACRKVEL